MILVVASVLMLSVIARCIDRFVEIPNESRADRATRSLLWAISALVVVEAGLGTIGLLTPVATLVGLAGPAAALFVLARRKRREPETRDPLSRADVGLCSALIAVFAFRGWAGVHKTTFLYDTLSYHLHVPAAWMHDHRLAIVPAVFGDPSPAYAPANLELVFLFLMAPLRSDYLAGVGQLPFAALAAVAIVAMARGAGGQRTAALGAALAFLLIPEIWGQTATAMTDLGLAACLLASLPSALRLYRGGRPQPRDLLPFAAAVGLTAGSKYAGAALALPIVVMVSIAFARERRHLDTRALRAGVVALVLLLATGGFWYVRNAVLAGNPLYPVSFPGLSLPALYGGAEMRAWDYHVPVREIGVLGSLLAAAGIGFVSAAAVAAVRLWRRVETWLLAALLAVFWLVIPYQESRFLFAILGVAAALVASGPDYAPAFVGWCALSVAIGGSLLEWPTRERLLLIPIAVLPAAGFGVWTRLPPRFRQRARVLTVAAAAAVSLAALTTGARHYAGRDPGYSVGDDLSSDWAWFRASVSDKRVAYTGTNVAFPLAGERLSNDVRYVNVAGTPGDRLHDFGGPGDGTAEPAPYRRGAAPDVWLANLRAARTQVLFVAALDPGVRRTIAADGDRFPIERAWADGRPDVFSLLHASPAARIYTVRLP